MNRIVILLLSALLAFTTFARQDLYSRQFGAGYISKEQYTHAVQWYLSGQYDKCIELAKTARGDDKYATYVLAYGAIAVQVKKETFLAVSKEELFLSASWAAKAIDILDKFIKNEKITTESSFQDVADYFDLITTARWCAHIVSDRLYDYGKTNKYDKLHPKYIKAAFKKTYTIRQTWQDYPLVQLYILSNAAQYFMIKDNSSKRINSTFLNEYWDCIDDIVALQGSVPNETYQTAAVYARTSLKSLSQSLIDSYLIKKKEPVTTVLDFLLKFHDFTLYINGAKQYRNFKTASWKRVQRNLNEGEYALIHFEGVLREGMFYFAFDSNTRRRNYALLFDKYMTEPELWVRGWRDQIETKNFLKFEDEYPLMKKLYVIGTDYMMLKDIIRYEPIGYRLHSLSELPLTSSGSVSQMLMIANIDFNSRNDNNDNNDSQRDSIKIGTRSDKLSRIPGDIREINIVKELFHDDVTILDNALADKVNVLSHMSKAKILHISSHGMYDQDMLEALNDDNFLGGFTGNNVLESCKIALSGYNDDGTQFLSAAEIKKLDLTNLDLVFLDACETGAGKSASGGTYSLVEAFHMAGVRNIIANLDPIKETVATKFAETFYRKISLGWSYHDAFYETKLSICPNQRIVFWE